ncbi:MAG: OmpA family protein [Bacteroidota bacterium]|nr:OmpA family protein [Bacteroidota bacterium]
MNKNYLLIFLIFNSTLSFIFSQKAKDYGFDYNFDDKKIAHNFVYNDKTFKSKIENGNLFLSHTNQKESYYIFEITYLNWKEDFTIATSFKLLRGKNDNGFGVCFGAKNIDNNFLFKISDNGFYCFLKNVKGKSTIIKDWVESPNVKTNGQVNFVEIKKEGADFNFYINKKLTYTHKSEAFYGFNFGYFVNGDNDLQSDFFTVHQKQTKELNLIATPNNFSERKNLGKNINTYGNEITPIISADEKTLFFTRADFNGNTGGKDDNDIWYSQFSVKDSSWGPAKNIGKPLNNVSNNFIQSVSHDNNTLIVGNKYTSYGEFKAAGFSISHKSKTGWSVPKDMNIKNYYNDNQYTETCMSPNGHVMLLALQRDQTEGFKDFYVSFLQADSSWSEPKNIGKIINTFSDETSPFIAADGVTLYFSSAGHPGFGSNDIFMSKRLDDTWLNWSTPKNLGPKINTELWDAYYTIPASGKNAYIVSNIGGNADIYMLKQPESAKPNPVILITGTVLNSQTKEPMTASIQYSELGSEKILGHSSSDPVTGKFTIFLPKGKKYSIVAFKDGFYSVHENTDVVTLTNYKEHNLDLYLTPIKKGQAIIINNLFFHSSSAEILPESYPELDKIAAVLKNNPKMKIQINGHTSKNNSDAKWNYEFSDSRVLAVKRYIVSKGIDEGRITHKGYGFDKPIYKELDEFHLAKNRRVEFVITE